MKRPFLAPVAWCIGGILCGWYLSVPLTALWVLVGVSLIVARRQWEHRWSLPLLCLLFGWMNTAVRTQIISANDLRLRLGEVTQICQLHGKIQQRPIVNRPTEGQQTPRWRTVVKVHSIHTDGRRWPAVGSVIVFSEGALHERLSAGMQVSVSGLVEAPARAKAPGIFDYREKLRREGIHYQLTTARSSDWILKSPGALSWPDRFQNWAKQKFAAGLNGEDQSLRLLWAMVLGWRTALTDEVAEPFMQSGTMHVFAISGLHIAMIAGVLVMLFRLFQLPRYVCGLLTVPLLWFYCEATGMQASATRATVMMTVIVFSWTLRRPVDLLNSVCAAAFIILAWEPRQLLQASFQLSFSVVSTIALVLPRFDGWKERLFQSDPLLPDELVPWWRRTLNGAGRWCVAALTLSFAAWLGSAPLIAYYFNLFTPGCLLANPFVVACAMFGICSSLGGIVTWCVPLLPECFNNSAWLFVTLQTNISQWVADAPGSWWRVPTPSLAEVGAYYVLLVGVASRWYRRRMFNVALGIVAMLLLGWRVHDSRSTEIIVFSHNANSVLINPPGSKHDLLIDCGRREGFRSTVKPYLDRAAIDQVPSLLLSHGDINHVEAFSETRSRCQPTRIFASHIRQRSPAYREALDSIEEKTIAAGDRINGWLVLHPPPEHSGTKADDAAVVLRGELGDTTVLLLSDLDERGQRQLLASGTDLTADLLIAGAPDGELLSELLAAVKPQLLVIQDNLRPVTEHASPSDLRRYGRYATEVFALSSQRSVRVRIYKGWQVAP